ncbi:hypothetical protein CsatA_004838 [Cannabis sativa]
MVHEEVRAPLRHYLLETYDIDLLDETTLKCIDEQMSKLGGVTSISYIHISKKLEEKRMLRGPRENDIQI